MRATRGRAQQGNASLVARRRALQGRRPGAPFANKRSSARQNTSPTLLFTGMALRPGLVFAEGVGSAFCPLTPSRRLHCLLTAAPAGAAHLRASAQRRVRRDGNTGLLE